MGEIPTRQQVQDWVPTPPGGRCPARESNEVGALQCKGEGEDNFPFVEGSRNRYRCRCCQAVLYWQQIRPQEVLALVQSGEVVRYIGSKWRHWRQRGRLQCPPKVER